jgi:DNA-binding PadR family transcriptional regulator
LVEIIVINNDRPFLEKQILEVVKERTIVAFLDAVIMRQLKDQPQSGYDIIQHVHNKFGILVSPGTVYAQLYSMQRKNLIKASFEGTKKRSYELTDYCLRVLEITNNSKEIKNFLLGIITEG